VCAGDEAVIFDLEMALLRPGRWSADELGEQTSQRFAVYFPEGSRTYFIWWHNGYDVGSPYFPFNSLKNESCSVSIPLLLCGPRLRVCSVSAGKYEPAEAH